MKIQWLGNDAFTLSTKDLKVQLNPTEADAKATFCVHSTPGKNLDQSVNPAFNLPGEFEVSGILAQGFYSDDTNNLVYKIVLEDTGIVFFGNIKEVPNSNFFEQLGENTDIIILNLSEDFDDKKSKQLIQQVTPRLVVLGGDQKYFPAMMENVNAKTVEENPYSLKALSDENTDVVILPI